MPLFRGRRIAKGVKVLKPVRANVGIAARYRRRLEILIEDMHAQVVKQVENAYADNAGRIAMDARPAEILRIAIARMAKRWQGRFDTGAEQLAEYFATSVENRSSAALRKILKDSGWTIEFNMSQPVKDVMKATVQANVSLIKSIPEQYLSGVETLVQQSIQRGGDLGGLTQRLQEKYGVTKRRAALISRDQNRKANAAFQKVRYTSLGIENAIWMHSHGGEVPRPSHVKMNGKQFDVKKGMWDEDEGKWIQPGELINCRCVARPVIPGYNG